MKKSLIIFLFCGSLLCMANSATAQDKKIGIGAMINSPTGGSAKVWFTNNLAVDGALSFMITENSTQIYIHSDILQNGEIIYAEQLQSYYGLGIRLLWTDVKNQPWAGLRGPLGIEYSFESSNVKSFFEIAPTLDFTPSTRFFLGGAVGMRIYLN